MPRSTTTSRPSPLSPEAAVDVRSRATGVAPALLWAGLFLLAWLAMTLIFTVNISLHRTAYNSDLIHPYLLLQDLLADPTAILSWQLSPAIYVFPDWPLAGLLVALQLPNTTLPLVYGGFLLAAYGFLIGWMLVAMQAARWPEAVLWGCLLIAGLFMASNSSPIGLGGTYLSFIATAYIHSGAVLAGMRRRAAAGRLAGADPGAAGLLLRSRVCCLVCCPGVHRLSACSHRDAAAAEAAGDGGLCCSEPHGRRCRPAAAEPALRCA